MKDFLDFASGSIQQVGLSFFMSCILPAGVFALIQAFVLIPLTARNVPALTGLGLSATPPTLPNSLDLSGLFAFVLVPLALGVLLLGMNSFLIRLYSGFVWPLNILLRSRTQLKRQQIMHRYGVLNDYRAEYQANVAALSRNRFSNEADLQQLKDNIQQIENAIRTEHERIDTDSMNTADNTNNAALPKNSADAAPTRLGNVLAVTAEYAAEHYGIDAATFWPRLYPLLQKAAPEHYERIGSQKASLDLSLNLSFLSTVVALEAALILVISILSGIRSDVPLILLIGIGGALLAIIFYDNCVSAAHNLGKLIAVSFDFYRGLILTAFNLQMPGDLHAEYALWIALAAFVRRAEPFYFPARSVSAADVK